MKKTYICSTCISYQLFIIFADRNLQDFKPKVLSCFIPVWHPRQFQNQISRQACPKFFLWPIICERSEKCSEQVFFFFEITLNQPSFLPFDFLDDLNHSFLNSFQVLINFLERVWLVFADAWWKPLDLIVLLVQS